MNTKSQTECPYNGDSWPKDVLHSGIATIESGSLKKSHVKRETGNLEGTCKTPDTHRTGNYLMPDYSSLETIQLPCGMARSRWQRPVVKRLTCFRIRYGVEYPGHGTNFMLNLTPTL